MTYICPTFERYDSEYYRTYDNSREIEYGGQVTNNQTSFNSFKRNDDEISDLTESNEFPNKETGLLLSDDNASPTETTREKRYNPFFRNKLLIFQPQQGIS